MNSGIKIMPITGGAKGMRFTYAWKQCCLSIKGKNYIRSYAKLGYNILAKMAKPT